MKTDIRKVLTVVFAVGIAAGLTACSSTKTNGEAEGEFPAEDMPPADAGTDPAQAAAANPEGQSADAAALNQMAGDPAAPPPPAGDPAADPGAASAMTAPPPSADPAPMPVAGSGQMDEYTVQSGDTLMKIAFETYGDLFEWKRIYEANKDKITNPNSIPKGVVLKVEKPATPVSIDRNGEKYLVKPGDTLGSISSSVYGTKSKWKKIWENNRQMIKNPNRIYAGFYLYYMPDGSSPAPVDTSPQPLSQQEPAQGAPPADAVAGGMGTQIAPPSGDAGAVPPPDGQERMPASDVPPPPAGEVQPPAQ